MNLLIFISLLLGIFVLAKRPDKPLTRRIVLLLPALFVMIQLLLVELRWQLAPAYVLACLLLIAGLANLRLSGLFRTGAVIGGILLLSVSALLSFVFPVYSLPEPGGPYTIGTTYLHMTDPDRKELISADPHDHRELMVRVWYPSNARPAGDPYPYMPPGLATTFAQTKGFPGFMLSHLDLISTHSFPDLPLAKSEGPFPVIIFNHGYMWHSAMYTAQMERLASEGYVVFSIDFTYETPVSVFPGGERRMFNQVFIDTIWQGLSHEHYLALQDSFLQEQLPEQKISRMQEMMDYTAFTPRIDDMVLDVQFVVDEIEAMNQNTASSWFGQLDVDRIGVMGHSVGGAVAGVACSIDPRIKAGLNMDGTQWGSLIGRQLDKPFMYMAALRDSAYFDPGIFIYEVTARDDFYRLTIAGTEHASFGDLSFWSRLHSLTQTGPIDGYRAIEIINHYSLLFFDQYLKNKPAGLADSEQEKYPEVKIEKRLRERATLSRSFPEQDSLVP